MANPPTFDLNARTEGPIAVGDVATASSRGLSMLSGAADAFGQRMRGMANAAAGREGAAAADVDLAAGKATEHNPNTAFGLSYNATAKLSKGADYKAALLTGLTQVQLDNADNVDGYLKAATAVRGGFGSTGFPDLDRELDEFATLQIASGQAKVLVGQQQRTLEQAHAGFMTTLDTEEAAIGHVVTTASFDQKGSELVGVQLGHSFDALAKYGPRGAFEAGGRKYEADPSRAGLLGIDDLQKAWIDMSAQARSNWATAAAMGLPDATAKRNFATDAMKRYAENDPLFAGMDREQFDHLHVQLDGIANRAETQEDGVRRQAATDTSNMLEAMANGGDVDTGLMMRSARASGDVGLIQKATVWASIGPQVPDVLRQIERRVSEGADAEGAWSQPLPTGAIFDQVRLDAVGAGIDADGQNALVRMANIESRGNPNAKNPNSSAGGVFQFVDKTWQGLGGGDKFDSKLNIGRAVQSIKNDRARLSKDLGRPATWGEAYLAHQQGYAGARALLRNPDMRAAEALAATGVKPAVALASIVGNGGTGDMTAAQFSRMWISKVDGGTPDANDPGFVAWANTKAGFGSDPLNFARGAKNRAALADVPALVPDGFLQGGQATQQWQAGLRQRYGIGQSLAQRFAVPARMFTDGEKAYYAGKMEQDPAYGVALAETALGALGGPGAQQLMAEIGAGGNAPVAVHLADLRAQGATRIVDAALDGQKLRAAGAKEPDVKTKNADGKMTDPFDDLQAQWAPAFQQAPQALIAARKVAEDARLSDRARGVYHPDMYYFNGALGAVSGKDYVRGGVTEVNGRSTVLPAWLRTDQAGAALSSLARTWTTPMPKKSAEGPVWADGTPMAVKDIAKLQMVLLPSGQYGLVSPKTNQVVRSRTGQAFTFDLDAARGQMGGQ